MDHQRIDERSLAFGRLIAARVVADPALVDRARATLRRWMLTCSPGVRVTFDEWMRTLDGPIGGVLDLLTSGDERATRLRQSNPFVGVLTTGERHDVIRQFADRHEPSAT